MKDFVYQALSSRVVFGAGTVGRVREESERLGLSRALVLCGPHHETPARDIMLRLGDRAVLLFSGAAMHTPVRVTEAALALARDLKVDGLVAIGGGSAIGLAKAIALRTDLPQLAIPTTYAGSEMTPILGETREGVKTTQRSPKVLPEAVIYDVNLTCTLPTALSAASGMNAIAHGAEALYAQDCNPVISLMAEQGIAALARALPLVVENGRDLAARSEALYGAWLCGTCLGAVGMALHHKLCHTLGGSFDLPHAEAHTIILPHALAYNASCAPEAMDRIARALGATDAAQGIYDLAKRLDAKLALRDIGMPRAGIERVANLAVTQPYWNPRPVEREAILQLLLRAWSGSRPEASGLARGSVSVEARR
ncbi:MAG: maleylacetate reductase [Proteobacteria bacterium]|nr:maleylacetate reductase [Pseudomonadota bacterium]MBI3497280.1 maleylacetate reductase [Pseudomonadota bacterium]